jgi:diadenylate cyclase
MTDLFSQLRWQDFVDIAIMAMGIYWIIHLIRGTRAVQMLLGLMVLFLTYFASRAFELYTLNWMLDNFLSSIILVIVVLFQSDIRRALTQVGRGSLLGMREHISYGQVLEEITRAAVSLAGKNVGALIVLEREVGLNEYIEVGTRLDAQVSKELMVSIFLPTSPIHDGALVIQKGRITAVGCFLPLTTSPNVSKSLGTRHRAAIGLTEETDAVVVVVSEEEGKISLVREGRLIRDLDASLLRAALQPLFVPPLPRWYQQTSGRSLPTALQQLFTYGVGWKKN